jgi:hypothetical protein
MNVSLIRQRLKTSGPHILRTSDGNEYEVPHPEFVLVGRHNVVIETPDGLLEIIDPLHIVAIRRRPAKPAKKPKAE